jgi:Ca2+-binding RTX toxin-like protein
MSTITTTGTPGTLLSTPDETFDDSMIASYGYFADHFEQVIYDILYGNGYAYSVSNTYLSAHLYGADGDVQVYGSGFYGSRSKISEIDFAGDGGTFVVKGSGSLNTARGTLTGSFTSIEAHHGSDGMLLEGRMNLDNNGYLVGTVTHQVAYSGSLTSEYFGKMSANSLNGTVTKVILHDNSGNSLTVTGKYTVAALQAVFDVTSTAEEVLNTASLFSGDDTFTVPDSAHAWHGFDGKDKLTGGALGDTLYGDEGNDTLYGLGGSDSLYGGNGDDILDGGTGADVMTGGAGNDKYSSITATTTFSKTRAKVSTPSPPPSPSTCRRMARMSKSLSLRAPAISTRPATTLPTPSPAIPATTGSTAAWGPTKCRAARATTPMWSTTLATASRRKAASILLNPPSAIRWARGWKT